jgi:hypothetical protein
VSAPLPTRRSLRQHVPSERARSNADVEDDDTNTITAGEGGQNGKRKKAAPKAADLVTATTVDNQVLTTLMAKLGELAGGVTELQTQMGILVQVVQQNETKIAMLGQQNEALLQAVKQNEARIAALETQSQTLIEMMKKSANEQVKITQSWAQVAAGAPAPPTSSPTPPGSRPSLLSGTMNLRSSASQTSILSPSAIILDLSRTKDRTADFPQLKEKINGALDKHEATKGVRCTGLQRRVGGEDRVKISFQSEDAAKKAHSMTSG